MSVRNTVKSIQDIMRKDSGVDGDAQRISQLCWMFFLKIIDDQDQLLGCLRDAAPIQGRRVAFSIRRELGGDVLSLFEDRTLELEAAR